MEWQKVIIIPLLLLQGCVAVTFDITQTEDPITEWVYWGFKVGVDYPRKQFMSRDEWDEYSNAPNSYKDALYTSYRNRERIEKDWENFINNCLLAFSNDCETLELDIESFHRRASDHHLGRSFKKD